MHGIFEYAAIYPSLNCSFISCTVVAARRSLFMQGIRLFLKRKIIDCLYPVSHIDFVKLGILLNLTKSYIIDTSTPCTTMNEKKAIAIISIGVQFKDLSMVMVYIAVCRCLSASTNSQSSGQHHDVAATTLRKQNDGNLGY